MEVGRVSLYQVPEGRPTTRFAPVGFWGSPITDCHMCRFRCWLTRVRAGGSGGWVWWAVVVTAAKGPWLATVKLGLTHESILTQLQNVAS